MAIRLVNLDGYDTGSPVEGKPYKQPTPEQVEKQRISLEKEARTKEQK